MITLYTFGPGFGLPDPSPFVMKAEVLLKLSGLDYRAKPGNVQKAPKGKLPFIDDNGTIVADSTHIRWHLEETHGIDFAENLSERDQAISWAFEKMCEDHLYWTVLHERWMDDTQFNKGPRKFFDAVPAPLRPIVRSKVRRDIRRNLHGHGMGRHSEPDICRHAASDLKAISDFLGDNPWMMGAHPSGADATVFSFVAGALCPHFDTASRKVAETYDNLVAYRDRGMNLWFPDYA
jgi:glutathione S-transferase